ncbi:MAG TPA: HAD-IA family hydrolase [Methylocella sp.]|nr:HAD-IA family hydrolase [Methylocella sp.]
MPLEALIFDVDGTLAETEEAHRKSFNEAFAAFGLDWIWNKELYRELLQVTGGKERLRHYIDAWKPCGRETALACFAGIYEAKSARYAALVASGAAPARPGVRRLITEAHERRVRLAIATTSLLGSVEAILRTMFGEEGPSWFAVIAAGDAVAHKKPAPDVYRFALNRLGCGPDSCVAIEDSENGVKAARAAGLPVIAAPSYFLSGDDFSLATTVLSDLGDPNRPCHQISGLRFVRDYVDIDGLNAWLSKWQQSSALSADGYVQSH